MKSLLERFKLLSMKKKMVIGAFIALPILGVTSNPSENTGTANNTKAVESSETSTEFPDIDGDSDGILEKILRDFYADNINAKWWGRIDKVVEGKF